MPLITRMAAGRNESTSSMSRGKLCIAAGWARSITIRKKRVHGWRDVSRKQHPHRWRRHTSVSSNFVVVPLRKNNLRGSFEGGAIPVSQGRGRVVGAFAKIHQSVARGRAFAHVLVR